MGDIVKVEVQSYMNPIPKTAASAALVLEGSCNSHTCFIGRHRIATSVTIFASPFPHIRKE